MLHFFRRSALGLALFLLLPDLLISFFSAPSAPPAQARAEMPRPGLGAWATVQLQRMTLKEKVSQLFAAQAGRFASTDAPSYERLVDHVERFGVGGVLLSRSKPRVQATLLNDLQARAKVPLLISQDMEWGAGMRVRGATTFPRPMAVGATRSPDLAYAVGYATAHEARALGTGHVYAPVADVNNNPDNPIINVRSFGEDPALVAQMVGASVRGLQDGRVLATAKHFPGHGDTNVDSHVGVPLLPFARARLEAVELVPFRAALTAGVKSVMTGHLALPQLAPDPTLPATLSPDVTHRLLREEMRFNGLVVTDALNMGGITNRFSPGEAAVRALEAGADVILMSEDMDAARAAVLRAVAAGRLSEARIDASVERLLRAKEWLDLHEQRTVDLKRLRSTVNTRPHRVLSEAVARRSLTLLRNEDGLLPFTEAPGRVLSVALSDAADPQAGGFFHRRLREHLSDSLLTTHVLDRRAPPEDFAAAAASAEAASVILVPAFVNVRPRGRQVDVSKAHRRFLERLLKTGRPVVLIAFGNPYLARDLPRPPAAYVAAYGADDASQKAVAWALFGQSGFSGKLPVTIPGRYAFGTGLQQEQVAPRRDAPEAAGMDSRRLTKAGLLLRHAIEKRAFPGAALAVGRGDAVVRLRGYGHYTYDDQAPAVTPQSRFDLASLTKVVVTTTAAMQLYEDGRLALDAPVARYLPAFGQNGKEHVTVRQLLTHSAGLLPFRPFYRALSTPTRQAVIDAVMAEPLQYPPGTQTEYSDLGFITLGLVIEEITGLDLAHYAENHIFEPLRMTHTGFRPAGHTDTTFVPTERDKAFRGRLLQGEVHDETAFLLGGTAGHAGLFSTAEDLSKFAYMLTHGGRIYGRQFLKEETLTLFTKRGGPPGSDRALGWDRKSADGYSSAGERFSAQSFGHTGFTGTSLWVDPEQNLFVVLLTNRVYPARSNRQITAVRPELADRVHAALDGPARPLLPGID